MAALQNAFNAVKSKALGVAEYMTPVLKVILQYSIFLYLYYFMLALNINL